MGSPRFGAAASEKTPLAAHGIDDQHATFEHQHLQQPGDSGNLARGIPGLSLFSQLMT
jgi:hypothetical protein